VDNLDLDIRHEHCYARVMPSAAALAWTLDPDDPRAPSIEEWERMSHAQRTWVIESLPSEFPATEECLPEGTLHYEAVSGAREVLRTHFGTLGRKICIQANMAVYYPREAMFSPDVMVVLDADDHPRNSWIVHAEGKGLDLCIEMVWLGWKKKDTKDKVKRYAELGIPEYFVFDMQERVLQGYRLIGRSREYTQLSPKSGKLRSEVLGLNLSIEDTQLRFFHNNAAVLRADECITRLDAAVKKAGRRIQDEAERARLAEQRARAETERAEREAERSRLAEQRLAELLAEIEMLKRTKNRGSDA
jgi:Uma2 family endonuclease